MLLAYFLVAFLADVIATFPTSSEFELPNLASDKSIVSRQILEANPTISCCTNCGGRYDYNTFDKVFDDFCTWAGAGLQLWTQETYYTNDYYCRDSWDPDVCIHLQVQYKGHAANGDGNAGVMDYNGCMGYFEFAIFPRTTCGGSPYPGARVTSADGDWVFTATADSKSDMPKKKAKLGCSKDSRTCKAAGSKKVANASPKHSFG